MNLLAELQRRHVIRMAGLYLVAAWLTVQVAATLLPVFDAPNWVMRAVVAVLAVGLIPALIVRWAFELIPTAYSVSGTAPWWVPMAPCFKSADVHRTPPRPPAVGDDGAGAELICL